MIQLGLHDKESKEILRRKSFKENKLENIWNLNDANIIRSFFNWVANSFQLPIESESQVNILSNLYKTLRLTGSYYEDDFCKAAEWSNQLYLDWKQNSRMSIYIIEENFRIEAFIIILTYLKVMRVNIHILQTLDISIYQRIENQHLL